MPAWQKKDSCSPLARPIRDEKNHFKNKALVVRVRNIPQSGQAFQQRRARQLSLRGVRKLDAAASKHCPMHPFDLRNLSFFARSSEKLLETAPIFAGTMLQQMDKHQSSLPFK
jgi:hypothetical protein